MIKRALLVVSVILTLLIAAAYGLFRASLPSLDQVVKAAVNAPVVLQRDALGAAVIRADNAFDAAFAMGFAHAQDRLFQMDLLRRSGAGEIAELFGEAALARDKQARFHQFRARAQAIFEALPNAQKTLLQHYSDGVNKAAQQYTVLPFEYILTQSKFTPWRPEDSLLTSFSMYIDLQQGQVERDFALTGIREMFGQEILDFLSLPSPYQAALDGSELEPAQNITIPQLTQLAKQDWNYTNIPEPIDIGSNNWAVDGTLTGTGHAMLSNDMHLGLNVPSIWYRASVNYTEQGQTVNVTGVSLPGSPSIIVGSNGHVAWGFTNSNLDNADWIELDSDTPTHIVTEAILVKQSKHDYQIEMSEFGPVKTLNNKRYALQWVAHQPYAVNLNIANMANVRSVTEAKLVAHTLGIPAQNMAIADKQGNISWTPAGAVTARPTPSNVAVSQEQYTDDWRKQEPNLPDYTNPINKRIWTANARVISTEQLLRYGDGGYALGVRGLQIRDRLFEKEAFTEQDFYALQLDNDARFLKKWHERLTIVLDQRLNGFSTDLVVLRKWQHCACPDSAGYTLVRRFRSEVINQLMSSIESRLQLQGLSLGPVLRQVEPAIQVLIEQQPLAWLPPGFKNWDDFLVQSYLTMRQDLLNEFVAKGAEPSKRNLLKLRWGTVNKLEVKHPFSRLLPILSGILDMPAVDGFGDSFMPAVQNGTHGASQRLIVQPGREASAILTIPGGQSGHPLSQFYRSGFNDFAEHHSTPLLPGEALHTVSFVPN